MKKTTPKGKRGQLNRKAQSLGERVRLGVLGNKQTSGKKGRSLAIKYRQSPSRTLEPRAPRYGAQGPPILLGQEDQDSAKETGEILATREESNGTTRNCTEDKGNEAIDQCVSISLHIKRM